MAEPPITALLVDDDPMLLALLAAFLESRGYAVAQAADGQEALARLDQGHFNLVVTDRHMPRMDGLALCRAIRGRAADSYVYCIMLTASFDEQSLVAAMEAGVDDFLAKPLRPAELGARLRAAERVLALEAQMATRNRELSHAYAQLSRDLELARALQISQLPPPGDLGLLRIDGMFEASSYVGGDLYDWFGLSERLLAFYLADVSGHGVAAAMMAVNVRAQLKAVSQQVASVVPPDASLGGMAASVVGAFNRRFLQMNETGLFLTLVYGLVDRVSGHAALVHAGHPPALHAGPGEPGFEPLGEGSLPVGILEDAEYEARVLSLSPGSRLVLYSDGITDCTNAAGEAFGDLRLRQLLERERHSALDATCASVREALRGWRTGSFEDDVTLLVLQSR